MNDALIINSAFFFFYSMWLNISRITLGIIPWFVPLSRVETAVPIVNVLPPEYDFIFTSCLAVCQNCRIITIKTSHYKIFNAWLINFRLRTIVSKYVIKFVVSFLCQNDFICWSKFDTRCLVIGYLFRDHWTNSNCHFDSCFCSFPIIFLVFSIHPFDL